MKFKTFLAMYRNIIILLWWIVILVLFKITTNFEFHHGLSLLFIFLVVFVPLSFYLITKIYQQKLIRAKRNRKGNYYQRIKKDFVGNKWLLMTGIDPEKWRTFTMSLVSTKKSNNSNCGYKSVLWVLL